MLPFLLGAASAWAQTDIEGSDLILEGDVLSVAPHPTRKGMTLVAVHPTVVYRGIAIRDVEIALPGTPGGVVVYDGYPSFKADTHVALVLWYNEILQAYGLVGDQSYYLRFTDPSTKREIAVGHEHGHVHEMTCQGSRSVRAALGKPPFPVFEASAPVQDELFLSLAQDWSAAMAVLKTCALVKP